MLEKVKLIKVVEEDIRMYTLVLLFIFNFTLIFYVKDEYVKISIHVGILNHEAGLHFVKSHRLLTKSDV